MAQPGRQPWAAARSGDPGIGDLPGSVAAVALVEDAEDVVDRLVRRGLGDEPNLLGDDAGIVLEHLVVDEARVGGRAGIVRGEGAAIDAGEAVSVVDQRRALRRVVRRGRGERRESGVIGQVEGEEVRVAREGLLSLGKLLVFSAFGIAQVRIDRVRAARKVGVDVGAAIALRARVQPGELGADIGRPVFHSALIRFVKLRVSFQSSRECGMPELLMGSDGLAGTWMPLIVSLVRVGMP